MLTVSVDEAWIVQPSKALQDSQSRWVRCTVLCELVLSSCSWCWRSS